MKSKETTQEPMRTHGADAGPRGSFKAGRGAKIKKGPEGQRKSLKRLNSAKEIQGFSWL